MTEKQQLEAQELRFYHKSVADWLLNDKLAKEDKKRGQPHPVTVDATLAHALLGRACFERLLDAPHRPGQHIDETVKTRLLTWAAAQAKAGPSSSSFSSASALRAPPKISRTASLRGPRRPVPTVQPEAAVKNALDACVPLRPASAVLDARTWDLTYYAIRHATWHLVLGQEWTRVVQLVGNLQLMDVCSQVDESGALCRDVLLVTKFAHSAAQAGLKALVDAEDDDNDQMEAKSETLAGWSCIWLLAFFGGLRVTSVYLGVVGVCRTVSDFIRFQDLRAADCGSDWLRWYQYALSLPTALAPHQQAAALRRWWSQRATEQGRHWVNTCRPV